MDIIEGLQKFAPWASHLPLIPKIALSVITVGLNVLFLGLVWSPSREATPEADGNVVEAYERMERILSSLYKTNGQITFEGTPIEPRLDGYYKPYVEIASYLRTHPKDIKGAYEQIWKHGGESRTFINDTNAFEAAVSRFFRVYEAAKSNPKAEA